MLRYGVLDTCQPLVPHAPLNQSLVEAWHCLPGGAGMGRGAVGWRGLLGRYTLPLTNMDITNIVGNGRTSAYADNVYGSWLYNGTDEYMELPYNAAHNPASYTLHAVAADDASGTGFRSMISTRWVSTGPTNIKGFILWGRDSAAPQPSFWNGDGTNAAWDTVTPRQVADTWFCVTATYAPPNMYVAVNQEMATPNTEGQYVQNTQGVLRIGASKSANDGAGPDAAAAFFMFGRIATIRIYNRPLSLGSMLALNSEASRGYPNLLAWR